MDLSFLDKSSHVTPLLIRLYDSHKLHSLAQDRKPEARAELTGAVSDLLQMDLTPRENELVCDVMISLMRQAEIDLRRAVSEHLATIDNVPLRLVLQMANDDIYVAEPILKGSSVLNDIDLSYIIRSKESPYWCAIAKRKALGDNVINMLADTKDFDTSLALTENVNISLTPHAIGHIAEMAKESDVLAKPLLRRQEVPAGVVSALYSYVGQELKNFITNNFDIDTSLLIDTVDDIVIEFASQPLKGKGSAYVPSQVMMEAAARFKSKGMLNIKLMLSTLRRGQIPSFIAQFACFTGLAVDTVEAVLKQENGQGLAVACRAFDVQKPDFVSIFLLTNKLRHEEKVADLGDMTKAVNYYNRMSRDVARSIIENSKGDLNSIK